ncbi:hypothetical protein ACFRQM_51615 [Streptomyces sp. NPDC056831]|uniref:hypothetical protein n=1 Tax=Streptomyces sp. NPDC056831 TaxID=3345954 RepID=UPI00368BF0E1
MSETTPNAKGPAPVKLTPEATEPVLIPADRVKPEDIGTLSIEYRDGQPVITVSSGTAIPPKVTVVDEQGNPVALYSAEGITEPQARAAFTSADHALIYESEHGLFDVSYATAWTLGR